MKVKDYIINEEFPMPSFYKEVLANNSFCILDIETTGLSSKYHQVILVGILYPHKNQTLVKQIFAENPKEEKNLLLQLAEILKDFNFMITYNGVTFDYPFLKERFKKYEIPCEHDEINHLDILYFLKKCKGQLPLENLKLKTVEKFIGIHRKDTISGQDSVELYKRYVSSPSAALEKTILLHNYEDIYYLAKVATVFDHFPSIGQLIGKTHLTFQRGCHPVYISYHPNDLVIKRNCLHVSGKTTKLFNCPEEVHYTPHYDFKWLPHEGLFQIEIPLKKTLLPTKEKFYYLNLNDFEPSLMDCLEMYHNRGIIHQQLMEINLCTSIGLESLISLLNFLICHVIDGKEASLSIP